MTTRLAIALLLALSLVAARGLAQDAPTPPRPGDAARLPTPAENAALVDTVVRTLARDFELPVSDVTIEPLEADALARILVNWGMRAELPPPA